jgi:hypothetical protein
MRGAKGRGGTGRRGGNAKSEGKKHRSGRYEYRDRMRLERDDATLSGVEGARFLVESRTKSTKEKQKFIGDGEEGIGLEMHSGGMPTLRRQQR